MVDSDPEAIAEFVRSKAPEAVRIGLETGPTTTWLWTELSRLGLPMICIDARHAKAVLKIQINKSDRNDAAGIARIMQTGWFKEVRVKDLDSHSIRALLASRALLVKIKRDLENQVRGLLKNLGLVIGRAKFNVFAARAEELIEGRPELVAAIGPLLDARKAIEHHVGDLDRKVLKLARHDVQVRRFMTAPGVGPITALCFKATIGESRHPAGARPYEARGNLRGAGQGRVKIVVVTAAYDRSLAVVRHDERQRRRSDLPGVNRDPIPGRHVQEHATEPVVGDGREQVRAEFPVSHSRRRR